MRKGKELEPLEPAPPTHVGWALYFARRFDESIEELRKVIAVGSGVFALLYVAVGEFLGQKDVGRSDRRGPKIRRTLRGIRHWRCPYWVRPMAWQA